MDFKIVYKTADGTTFDTKAEAEAYAKLMEAPHVKKLIERVERLEKDILTMKAEIATLHRDPAKPCWPGGPQVMFNGDNRVPLCHEAYNPATGGKL